MKSTLLSLALFITLFSTGCEQYRINKQAEVDKESILQYLSDHSITAQSTASGLYYTIEQQGTGVQPDEYSTVNVIYKGYLLDGTIFDKSSAGAWISLISVIKGWREGIPLFREGGKGKLFIPSKLGYGEIATGSIPANSVLIFDVELVEVEQ